MTKAQQTESYNREDSASELLAVVVKYRTDLMTNAGVERKNSTDDAAHALWCFENST